MRGIVAWLVVMAALAGCRKDEKVPPAYEPQRERKVYDAAPPPPVFDAGDTMLGEDNSVTQCINECVKSSQMRAQSPASIRLACTETCEGRCVDRCMERNRRRGLPDGGLLDGCIEICRLD